MKNKKKDLVEEWGNIGFPNLDAEKASEMQIELDSLIEFFVRDFANERKKKVRGLSKIQRPGKPLMAEGFYPASPDC